MEITRHTPSARWQTNYNNGWNAYLLGQPYQPPAALAALAAHTAYLNGWNAAQRQHPPT